MKVMSVFNMASSGSSVHLRFPFWTTFCSEFCRPGS